MSFYSAIFSPNPNVFKNKLGVCVWMEWVGYICCQASLNPRLNFFPISVFPLALASIHFPSLNDPSELFHNFPVTFELNAHCTCSPFPSTGLTCALGKVQWTRGFSPLLLLVPLKALEIETSGLVCLLFLNGL